MRKISYMVSHLRRVWEISIISVYRDSSRALTSTLPAVHRLELPFPSPTAVVTDTLTRVLTSHAPDIMHSMHLYADIYAIPASIRARIPVAVRTVHGITQLSSTDNFCRTRVRVDWDDQQITEQLAVDHACAVTFTVSKELRRRLIRYGFSADKTATLYHGVDTRHFIRSMTVIRQGKTIRQRFSIAPTRIVVGVLGRLDVSKNPAAIVDCYSRSKKLREKSVAVFVGGGPLEGTLREAVAMRGLNECMKFVGSWPLNDVRQMLSSFDVLAVPSRTEGLPFAILEAMAMQVPVVANAVGGIPEIIAHGEDGFLSTRGTGLFVHCLEMLVEDSALRREIGRRARAKICSCFDVRARMKQESMYYLDLLSRR
jgi:glycosyltransferase involved in cell wall biosynthesis